jgi:uncharacterized membrane protein
MGAVPCREELLVFDLINGLPVHPLVVHAVVVLIPLAAVGAIAIALKPAWRRSHGPIVVAFAVLSAILCPVATSSGEALERHVGAPGDHAELGDQLIWFVIPLAIFSLALVLLDRRRRAVASTAVKVVAALAILAGLATTFQAYRVGDSGARAAWGDRVSSSSGPGSGESGD